MSSKGLCSTSIIIWVCVLSLSCCLTALVIEMEIPSWIPIIFGGPNPTNCVCLSCVVHSMRTQKCLYMFFTHQKGGCPS